VIEPSAGVDRLILALITNAYSESPRPDNKGKNQYARDFEISSARGAGQGRRDAAAQEQAGAGEEGDGSPRSGCVRG